MAQIITSRIEATRPQGSRVYRAPEVVEYGPINRLTLGSGGTMLDISIVDFGFINDTANCNAADQLTCFVAGSV
jgi:hypothetical protein